MTKLWKDMSPEEKGALLLAHHEGKVIESSFDCVSFYKINIPKWFMDIAYRVKPAPEVKPWVLYLGKTCYGVKQGLGDTHKITFNFVDGEPDVTSIKMEKL